MHYMLKYIGIKAARVKAGSEGEGSEGSEGNEIMTIIIFL